MDWPLILLRIVHIGAAMSWFGGAIISSFFLLPTAQELGPAAQPFINQLMNRRRMGIFFPIVASLTILAGAGLYWRDPNGLDPVWISSPSGLAFTLGGLAAIIAFVGGMALIAPSVAEQSAVRDELAASGDVPTLEQLERLARADRRMRLANRIDLPLILVAALTMAVGRYL